MQLPEPEPVPRIRLTPRGIQRSLAPTSSSLGHFRDVLALGTARRVCPWPGTPRIPLRSSSGPTPLPLTCHSAFSAAPRSAESALSSPAAGRGPRTPRCPAGCTLSSPKWCQTIGGSLRQVGWGRGREGVRAHREAAFPLCGCPVHDLATPVARLILDQMSTHWEMAFVLLEGSTVLGQSGRWSGCGSACDHLFKWL